MTIDSIYFNHVPSLTNLYLTAPRYAVLIYADFLGQQRFYVDFSSILHRFLMHVLIHFDFLIKNYKLVMVQPSTIISWILIYRLLVDFWTVEIYEVSGHNICSVKIKNWFQQSEK